VPSVPSMPEVVVRHDWTLPEVRAIHDLPLLELVYRAQTVHRATFGDPKVQLCSLLSIKTGGCPEDCGYCSQSAYHKSGVKAEKLMDVCAVLAEAKKAKAAGATRFCMGAAWRAPKDRDLDGVCAMVEGVRALGMETCATLGLLTAEQARRLKAAGLDYYNHNLDTSEEFYGEIITTRCYQDRLDTLDAVRAAGLNVCCGGIIGMGESPRDRAQLLVTLAGLPEHPQSVPINQLVRVPGTPLADAAPVDPFDFVRTIAVARIMMPRAQVRLSAGRETMSDELQALAFLAGANSIFYGEKLLVTGNPDVEHDRALLARLGMHAEAAGAVHAAQPPALAASAAAGATA